MGMLLTTIGFVALSVWLVARHVRRTAAPPSGAPCPRCRGMVPAGAAFCPGCGVPLQAYELVSAPLATATVTDTGPLHALVRADVCVGCGTCVGACPEPGAIRLVDKVATVDLDRCKGHGSCAAACPVGAIVVTTGAAVQRVEVPSVDAHFETNVPGLYVVGELGGRGLIKNAVNEGKIAVEHAAQAVIAGRSRNGDLAPAMDLAIVGSGPAGLSAALEAQRQGLDYVVLEQGTLSDTIRKYPRQKLLLAEPVRTPLYGDLWVSDASKETLLEIWQNVITRRGLRVKTGERVESVVPELGGFRLVTSGGEYRARRVVLAMGRRGTPRRLGVPGEDADHVFFDIVEMEAFAGQRLLVVGGGDSAVESALGLCNQPGTAVALSYRGQEFGRIKDRNRAKLDQAVAAGRIRPLLGSQVKEIRRDVVVLEIEGRPHLEPAEVVIVRVGGEAPFPFLERCGVQIVRKELALAPATSAG